MCVAANDPSFGIKEIRSNEMILLIRLKAPCNVWSVKANLAMSKNSFG